MVDDQAASSSEDHRAEDSRDPTSLYRFRNYSPQSKFLDGLCATSMTEPLSIKPLIQDKLDLIPKDGNYSIDHQLLETKKVDWDLKRRFEKRLQKLENNTSKAISAYLKDQKNKKEWEDQKR